MDKIRSITGGRNHMKLAALAMKAWPKAFEDFGPTVSFASALTLAASRDWALLGAQKSGEKALWSLLTKTKPKVLRLKKRVPISAGWADLAPLNKVDPSKIQPEDRWEEENMWDEMKDLNVPRWKSARTRDDAGEIMAPLDDVVEIDATTDDQSPEARGLFRKVQHGKEMALLDPELWVDDGTVPPEERRAVPRWSVLQDTTEKNILAALEEMEKNYPELPEKLPPGQDWDWEWDGTLPLEGAGEDIAKDVRTQ